MDLVGRVRRGSVIIYRRLERWLWVLTEQVIMVDGCVYDVGGYECCMSQWMR